MEISKREHDMSDKIKDRDTLVSVDDAGDVAKKEYESYIKRQEKDVSDDLDNQYYSEGEQYD